MDNVNNNIQKESKKRSYRQPLLKEIGKVRDHTKGTGSAPGLDSGFPLDTVVS